MIPTLVLVGVLDDASMADVWDHCQRLRAEGHDGVVLEASGVRRCERGGLAGLRLLLDGRAGIDVRVTGTHGNQFLDLLAGADLAEVTALWSDIRRLRGHSPIST